MDFFNKEYYEIVKVKLPRNTSIRIIFILTITEERTPDRFTTRVMSFTQSSQILIVSSCWHRLNCQ